MFRILWQYIVNVFPELFNLGIDRGSSLARPVVGLKSDHQGTIFTRADNGTAGVPGAHGSIPAARVRATKRTRMELKWKTGLSQPVFNEMNWFVSQLRNVPPVSCILQCGSPYIYFLSNVPSSKSTRTNKIYCSSSTLELFENLNEWHTVWPFTAPFCYISLHRLPNKLGSLSLRDFGG